MLNKELADVLVGGLFAITVATNAGIADLELLTVDFSEVVTTFGGATITVASTISIVVLLYAYLLGMPDFGGMPTEKQALSFLTIGIVILGMVSHGYAADNTLLGIAAVGFSAGGYWAMKYN